MDNNPRRQKAHSTGDIFTFPAISQSIDFDSELADQLFSNGKFLLHDFPIQPANFTIPRSTILSRTSSSITSSSKGSSSSSSLMSSRSNSTNSSSSSARTSISGGDSYRRNFKLSSINQIQSRSGEIKSNSSKSNAKFPKNEGQNRTYCDNNNCNKFRSVEIKSNSSKSNPRFPKKELGQNRTNNCNQSRSVAIKSNSSKSNGRYLKKELGQNRTYCSQRWQFIAPVPVPVLSRRNSLKKRKGGNGNGKQDGGVRKGVCRRFLGWLVSTCQECHAIEPSKRLKVSM